MQGGNDLKKRIIFILIFSVFFISCSSSVKAISTQTAETPESCPPYIPGDLSGAPAFTRDNLLPFRFPLDEFGNDEAPFFTNFCASSDGPESARKYHAAEDFLRPAGTPVYAMADGNISFSGPMDGYGWLIIIDHPQANIYSLYGHLSPSRWRIRSGTVDKGELISYLGDSNENGGSVERPLEPHLHFGIRSGQRSDYPGMGEWRWQAGWIKPCPRNLGWLQPSAIIINQDITIGEFTEPEAGFAAIWGIEILFAVIYLLGGVCMLIFAIRKNKIFVLALSGVVLLTAGWFFFNKGTKVSYLLFIMAFLFLVIGIFRFIRRSTKLPHT